MTGKESSGAVGYSGGPFCWGTELYRKEIDLHAPVAVAQRRITSALCRKTECDGGAEGNRTPDLIIANDALYQLSYSPAFEIRP
jgi:hypothetical protein